LAGPVVRINRERLWANLMQLKEIGAYDDTSTRLRGVRRRALTGEDAEARRLVVGWMREAGLRVRVDRIGNVYAERAGTDPSLPCVRMGSHIDTVATGGAFDGTLGVLGGVEVMRALNEAGIRTRRPIEIGFFTEEEGVRFGTDMLGSAVTAGRLTLEYAHNRIDADGATVRDERVRIGFDGDTPEIRPVPHAYIECHIEQGPLLAAEVVVEIRRMCDSGRFGQLRGTVGNLALQPSQTNVIPSEAVLTVDLRNPDDDLMTAAEKHLARFVDDLQQRYGLNATCEQMAKTAMVPFHESIQDVIAASAEALGLPYVKAMSGAGHDAQEIAATCPTAMVFVAGEYGGISHTPREYSRPDACGNGIDVLANAILILAEPVHTGPTA
jgi:N-carbamoyl-L-amino-acid hydrolase